MIGTVLFIGVSLFLGRLYGFILAVVLHLLDALLLPDGDVEHNWGWLYFVLLYAGGFSGFFAYCWLAHFIAGFCHLQSDSIWFLCALLLFIAGGFVGVKEAWRLGW